MFQNRQRPARDDRAAAWLADRLAPHPADLWWPLVAPHLPPHLHGAPVERARRVCRRLPAGALLALESDLTATPGEERLDVAVRLTRPGEARRVGRRLPAGHVARFLGDWADRPSLRADFDVLWIEIDLRPGVLPPSGLPPAILCARLRPGVSPRRLVRKLLPRLHGRPLSHRQAADLRRCLRLLPADTHPLYLFSLPARPGAPVRLELFGPPAPAVADFVTTLLLRSDPTPVAELFNGVERIHLSFDFTTGGVHPRFGIEGGFRGLPGGEPGWRRLFGRLSAAGLCTAQRAEGAFAWTGHDSRRSAPETWPGEPPMPPGVFLVRALSHAKVVAGVDAPHAKVYLLAGAICRSG